MNRNGAACPRTPVAATLCGGCWTDSPDRAPADRPRACLLLSVTNGAQLTSLEDSLSVINETGQGKWNKGSEHRVSVISSLKQCMERLTDILHKHERLQRWVQVTGLHRSYFWSHGGEKRQKKPRSQICHWNLKQSLSRAGAGTGPAAAPEYSRNNGKHLSSSGKGNGANVQKIKSCVFQWDKKPHPRPQNHKD